MSRIEIFNTHLNQSNTNLGNRSKLYKEQIMFSVSNRLKLLTNNNKVVVIGAGSMSDIDITVFARFFNEVILTDIDLKSVSEAVENSKLSYVERRKIKMIRTEYTGFEINHFFDDFKERIVNCHSFEKIEQVLNSKLKDIENYKFLKEYKGKVDFLFVSPIYTQLIYNQVLRECSILRETGYPEHNIKFIENFMLDQMIPVINRFNQNLIEALHKDGELFVLSDIFQLDTKSDFYKRVEHSIMNIDVMDEIYNGYKKQYGMGLGDYGLYNLDELLQSKMSKWLIWPFTEQSSFIVKLKIYKKRT